MLSRQVGPLPGPSGEEKILKFDTSLEAYLYVFLAISQCSSNFLAGGFDREGYFSSVFQLADWEPGPGEERSRLYLLRESYLLPPFTRGPVPGEERSVNKLSKM